MLADKEDKLQITGIWQNSPASELGLSPADELLSVEGKVQGEITNKELINIMMDTDISEFRITVLKQGVEVDYILKKRELFD